MCGISGIFSNNLNFKRDYLREQSLIMAECQAHRGPDDFGQWEDQNNKIFFSHNRLSIIDLTKNGSQPMTSKSGRYRLMFNGEIYNHLELKREIIKIYPNIVWKGTSDTEVLLQCIDHYGLNEALKIVVGMYAIALWDSKDKKLILARDRFGEKPLYFYICNSTLYFSSELKSIEKINDYLELNLNSLKLYLNFGFINSNNSIYNKIEKIPPGSFLEFSEKNLLNNQFCINIYWNAENIIRESQIIKKKEKKYNDIVIETEKMLEKIVSKQLVADVNVGTFLSGGTDSSVITYLAQKCSFKKIKTFSIEYDNQYYNEGNQAKDVAEILKTDHSSFVMEAKDFENFLVSDTIFYDEPFFDLSQFPTLLLCKFAKKKINVALTGDGGDEIFGGYNRYKLSKFVIPTILAFPTLFRSKLVSIIKKIEIQHKSKYNIFLSFLLSRVFKFSQIENKKQRILEIIKSQNEIEMYFNLLKCDFLSSNNSTFEKNYIKLNNITNNFMINDIAGYLPNNILYKIDTASMNYSLELRSPFLDHKLFEHTFLIPLKYKFKNGKSKSILKSILEKKLPKNLIHRPKMGFDFPIYNWTKTSTRLKKILQELFCTKLEIVDSQIFNDYEYKNLISRFEINEKNIFYIWKIVNIKKWFLRKKSNENFNFL
jgi:asparagine synthase (glutamine-hydrolysing)